MYKSKISLNVKKLFLFIVFLQYIIPFFGILFFFNDFTNTYKLNNIPIWTFIFILAIIIIIFISDSLVPKLKFTFNFLYPFQKIVLSNYFNLFLSIVFFVFAVNFFNEFGIDYRHHNELNEAKYVIIIFTLSSYFKAFMFFCVFTNHFKELNPFIFRIILLFLVFSFLMTMTSSFHIIYFVLSIILLLNKTGIFYRNKGKISFSSFLMLPLFFSIIIAIIFIGVANKIGLDETKLIFLNVDLILGLFKHVVLRLSTWLISYLVSINLFFIDPYFAFEPFLAQFVNLINRFAILFNNDVLDKPEIWSINRLNFLNVFIEDNRERTGTSPGIFACFFYFPIFPFNFLILLTYIIFILRLLSNFFSKNVKLSFIGFFISYFFIIGLFENPLDYLNFLSPGFVYFFTFLIFVSIDKKEYYSYNRF
jgi:hypothetical protein